LRILVVKRGDLGDFLLTTPALRALREARPRARIDLVAPRLASRIVGGAGLVDRHIPLPRARGLPLLVGFAKQLRRGRYDACVLLEHLTTRAGIVKYAALALASGAPRRYGLDNGRGWFLTDRVHDDGFGSRPEAEQWLRVVALLGADPSPRPTELPVSDAEHRAAAALLDGLPRPIVALHPGGGEYTGARRWWPERFAAVGRELVARHGGSLVVVGNEIGLNAAVAAACGARDLSGGTSLGQLAALLGRVDLLVTNDSGVAHVGAAANAPIVAVYGQTDPRTWAPYYGDAARSRAEAVQVPLPCRPCLYRKHELGWRSGCATRDCLELVSVGMVLAAAERRLATAGRS
jgi:lipopolysaccharide heptosyltransferase II